MTLYPTLEEILSRAAQEGFVVRDLTLLQSALARPQTTVFGREVFESLSEKFAALVYSLAQNQALLDGNKRLALGAGLLFLRLNDHCCVNTHDELFNLMIDMARGMNHIPLIAGRVMIARIR
ncbi:MAG: type II toxin-antitoxin system death-on-curing family toxin [Angustibacter sp.]